MRTITKIAFSIFLLAATPSFSKENVDMKIFSESLGNYVGKSFALPGVQLDMEAFMKGMRHASQGKPSPLSEDEFEAALLLLHQNAHQKIAEANLEKTEKFLEKIGSYNNITTVIPGKLYYRTLRQGNGKKLDQKHTPIVHYKGKFIDGTSFGDTEITKNPITMPLKEAIPGIRQGILNMQEGEKRRLYIHPELAYGDSKTLPPNSLLILDIELIEVKQENLPNTIDDELNTFLNEDF